MPAPSLTADRLRELLHYDPETGVFTWLVVMGNNVRVGDVAGSIRWDGYRRIMIDGREYPTHRLAWFFVHGEWPAGDLDHIKNDCRADRSDNRLSNLRPATSGQNQSNRRADADGSSSFKGVCWDKRRSKWQSRIRFGGKEIFLGYFDTAHEAALHYEVASICLQGAYRRPRFSFDEIEHIQLSDRALKLINNALWEDEADRRWAAWCDPIDRDDREAA